VTPREYAAKSRSVRYAVIGNAVRGNWQRINKAVREALERVTLADLARPMAQPLHFSAPGKVSRAEGI